jgi:putative acetyltransferase
MDSKRRFSKMIIKPGDFRDPQVIALLRAHLAGMNANSPAGSVYALDLSSLQSLDITFLTVWQNDILLGCGALKELSPVHGEIKSMRTGSAHLRQGVAARTLEHIIGLARARGYRKLSLETGSGAAFDPALALYRKRGFKNGDSFGDYVPTEFNQFLHLTL